MKLNRLERLGIDLAKVLGLAIWVWLFAVWVEADGSPSRMLHSIQAKLHGVSNQRDLTAKASRVPAERRVK